MRTALATLLNQGASEAQGESADPAPLWQTLEAALRGWQAALETKVHLIRQGLQKLERMKSPGGHADPRGDVLAQRRERVAELRRQVNAELAHARKLVEQALARLTNRQPPARTVCLKQFLSAVVAFQKAMGCQVEPSTAPSGQSVATRQEPSRQPPPSRCQAPDTRLGTIQARQAQLDARERALAKTAADLRQRRDELEGQISQLQQQQADQERALAVRERALAKAEAKLAEAGQAVQRRQQTEAALKQAQAEAAESKQRLERLSQSWHEHKAQLEEELVGLTEQKEALEGQLREGRELVEVVRSMMQEQLHRAETERDALGAELAERQRQDEAGEPARTRAPEGTAPSAGRKPGVIRAVLVDPEETSRKALRELVREMDLVWLQAECAELEAAVSLIREDPPDFVLVGLEPSPEQAVAFIEQVAQACPSCTTVVVGDSADNRYVLPAVRAGAKDYLQRPVRAEDLIEAFHRLSQDGSEGADGEATQRVITLLGAGGGVGCTTLAVNLGCAMAQARHRSVALMDLDLTLGATDACLDVYPTHTLAGVAAGIAELDLKQLKQTLVAHASGLSVLSRPEHLVEVSDISAEQVRRVIGMLRATFSHVVVDAGTGFLPPQKAAMQMADDVLLVTRLEVPCLRNAVRLLHAMERTDRRLVEKTRVILNQPGKPDGEISLAKAEQTLGRGIYWEVPHDWPSAFSARSRGEPLVTHAPRSRLNKSICELGDRLATEAAARRPGQLRSRLGTSIEEACRRG